MNNSRQSRPTWSAAGVVKRKVALSDTAILFVHHHRSGAVAGESSTHQGHRRHRNTARHHVIVGKNGHASLKVLKPF
jgi:hypothetical protein